MLQAEQLTIGDFYGASTEISTERPPSRSKTPRDEDRDEVTHVDESSGAQENSASAALLKRCMDNTCECSIKWRRTSLCSRDSASETNTSDDDDDAQQQNNGENRKSVPAPPPQSQTPVSTSPSASAATTTWTLEYWLPTPPPPPKRPPRKRRSARRASSRVRAAAAKVNGDMKALLDPNESPKVVLRHPGRDSERIRTPPIEDSFMLIDHFSEAEDSSNGSLFYVFTTEDSISIDIAESVTAYIPSPSEAAAAAAATAAAAAATAAAAQFQNSVLVRWEDVTTASPEALETTTTATYYCL
ncbi:hypothetical protein HPB50_026095 [Hyalomma asiaticum]|uniref:Uncharacterized protein n=1 Tax=Hyalomma asiaticum TaxID=266040 RepID=A0ACB7TMD2_HYAAI|nr:hypothetical protein HPB50_026095 [Hyalomma asiaticum]